LRFIARGAFAGSISFLITGDEEGPAINGTVKLVDWALAKGETFDHCILGESTSCRDGRRHDQAWPTRLAQRTARNQRRQGHAAYPHIADNPIPALAPILTALLSPPLDQGNADFEPTNLGSGFGRRRQSGVQRHSRRSAPQVQCPLQRSVDAGVAPAEIKRRVAAADVAKRTTLTFEPSNAVAFLTKPGPFTDLVAKAVSDVTGRKPALSTGGGTSDARFIKNACPVVELGLVNATIHAVNERVALDDLEALSLIYERALELYFAQVTA
jgi:succinyl-diaminopimelate desuccinylase